MRRVVAALGLVWALLNVVVASFFVSGAFTAHTAQKEGILAQLSLLLGGVAIEVLASFVAWQAWRLFRHRVSE